MPDTISETPNEAQDLRQEVLALRAELAGLRASATASAGPARPAPSPLPAQGGLGRRMAFAVYRLVRPIVRPLAWRMRSFMLAPVLLELAELRGPTQGRPATLSGGSTPAAMDPALSQAVERLLLTLALEDRSRPR